jgi:hypothetical protein
MTDIATPAAPLEEKPSSSFSRMIGVLFSPGRTFEEIARKPDWFVPALVIMVISVVSVIALVPHVDFESTYREAFEAQHMAADQQDKAIRIASAFGKAAVYVSPLFAIGALAVVAAIYFLGIRLLGGQGTFLQAFSVVLYSTMPRLLKGILGIPIAFTKHGIKLQEMENIVRSNLSFLTDFKTHPMQYAVLSALDAFAIWSLILAVIGLAAMSKLSKAKAAAIVIVVACLGLLVRVGGAAMQALRAAK